MTIQEAITRADRKRSPGTITVGHWRVVTEPSNPGYPLSLVSRLVHYGTTMLAWDTFNPSNPEVLTWDTGWGSVSDQNGMNKAFRVLGLPFYYSRKGGASVESVAERIAA